MQNIWFSGSADVSTYELEELLGTKMRALYQRKKGRDLYDMAMAQKYFRGLNHKRIVECFQAYMSHEKKTISRAQYEANLEEKLSSKIFVDNMTSLLSPNSPKYDVKKEGQKFKENFLPLLPGESWKGADKRK